MAANQLRVKGTTVDLIRHNNMERLEAMIQRVAKTSNRIWYMADGVYSMFADLAPFAELRELLDRYEQLYLYIDDSHGVGWAGKHGRGPALDVARRPPARGRGLLAEQVVRAPRAARWSSRTPRCAARCDAPAAR